MRAAFQTIGEMPLGVPFPKYSKKRRVAIVIRLSERCSMPLSRVEPRKYIRLCLLNDRQRLFVFSVFRRPTEFTLLKTTIYQETCHLPIKRHSC